MAYELDLRMDGALADRVPVDRVRDVVESLLASEAIEQAALTIVFGGDELLQGLNRDHRGYDEPTDVLSFPSDEGERFPQGAAEEGSGEPRYLGDIAVSVPFAERQAHEAGRSLEDEIAHLVAHGTYHLLGFDHETEAQEADFKRREEALLGPGIHADGHEVNE